jgi:hypothetical protein
VPRTLSNDSPRGASGTLNLSIRQSRRVSCEDADRIINSSEVQSFWLSVTQAWRDLARPTICRMCSPRLTSPRRKLATFGRSEGVSPCMRAERELASSRK